MSPLGTYVKLIARPPPCAIVLILVSALYAAGLCASSKYYDDICFVPLPWLFTFVAAPFVSTGCAVMAWRKRGYVVAVLATLVALPQLTLFLFILYWMYSYWPW